MVLIIALKRVVIASQIGPSSGTAPYVIEGDFSYYSGERKLTGCFRIDRYGEEKNREKQCGGVEQC